MSLEQRIEVGGTHPFTITYNPLTDEFTVDGVRVAAEVLRQMIVDPNPSRKLRFRRSGGYISVSSEVTEEPFFG